MKAVVRAAFPGITDGFEGCVPFLYTDVLGLVTTARGNLIDYGKPRRLPSDPIIGSDSKAAELLPWQNRDGSPAERYDVHEAFQVVKAAWPKVQSVACGRLTTIRLSADAIDDLTFSKLDEMWRHLLGYFPNAEDWCADAQLGLVLMAWAVGAAFAPGFPHFTLAAKTGDWIICAGPPGDANAVLTARGQAWMRDGSPGQLTPNLNPGLRKRNLAVKTCFTNAQFASDPETLYYPQMLPLSGAV